MRPETIPVVQADDDPAPVFAVESRETAFATLTRIAHSTGATLDTTPAGHYTRFIPGWLHLLYDDVSRRAWLCDATMDGRLATVVAEVVWGMPR